MGSEYEKYTFLNNQNSTLRTLTIFLLKAAGMAGTTYEQEEYKKNADTDNYVQGKIQLRLKLWFRWRHATNESDQN